MVSITPHYRAVIYSLCLSALMLAAVFAIDLAFWQLNRIQEEQVRSNHLTRLTEPCHELKPFAQSCVEGEALAESRLHIRQNKTHNQAGMAHLGVIRGKNRDAILVMHNWTSDNHSVQAIPEKVCGPVLPFHLLERHKIHTPLASTWEDWFKTMNISPPEHFIISNSYPNLRYYRDLYAPRYTMHYSYATQFFILSVTLCILIGLILKKLLCHDCQK